MPDGPLYQRVTQCSTTCPSKYQNARFSRPCEENEGFLTGKRGCLEQSGWVRLSAKNQQPKAKSRLIRPLRLMYTLIHRLAPGKAFAHAVPVGNRRFPQLPAEQDNLSIHLAGEIQ